MDAEFDDQRNFEDGSQKIIHQITAGPHRIQLMLRQDASPDRILDVLYRRTGITGGWKVTVTEEGDPKTGAPRKVFLVPTTKVTVPNGIPNEMIEARVFFGTLERKSIVPREASPEEILRQLAMEAKLDDKWVIERAIPGNQKSCPIVIAKRNEDRELRQALPAGLESFVADHFEGGVYVNQHVIKCKGGESPDQQAHLVSQAFKSPMKITEWVHESDDLVHLQCSRLAFVTIRFS
jgi:hypothetical protein